MTQETFNLLDIVNRNDYDNCQCGFIQDVESTTSAFGTVENISLEGMYLYIYMDEDDNLTWDRKEYTPTHLLSIKDSKDKLHLFKLD